MGDGGVNILGNAAALRSRGTVDRARTLYYVAAAVLAALVPLILFAGLWVRTILDQGERDLQAFVVNRAHALSARLDAEVEQHLAIIQAFASVQDWDTPDPSTFQVTASRMIAAFPQWALLAIIDPTTGHQLANSLPASSGELLRLTQPDVVDRVVETRKVAVVPRYPDQGSGDGQGVVLLYAPVVREDAVRAVLALGLKAETVQQILVDMNGDDLLTVVVDQGDRILARSHGFDRFFGKKVNDELRRSTSGRDEGLFAARTLDDQEVITAFRRSALTGWRAVAAMDLGHFDALDGRSTWALIGTGAFSLALAGILVIFIFYTVVERRVNHERLAASWALSALDARLLATTQEALAVQRKSAGEREVLLREIYHRVKNNLQIVQSLLRLGSRDLQPEQREPFEGAIRRVGAMARVHSLLYKSPDLASINFKDYLEDLAKEVSEGFGADMRGIAIDFDVEPMRVSLDTAVPLAFITVEILTNAFKHAFPDGRRGRVAVAARQDGERGILTIADDGIGLPEPSRGRGLGLHLVNKLVEQIGGTIEAPPPGGSIYRITFPLDSYEISPLPQGSL